MCPSQQCFTFKTLTSYLSFNVLYKVLRDGPHGVRSTRQTATDVDQQLIAQALVRLLVLNKGVRYQRG